MVTKSRETANGSALNQKPDGAKVQTHDPARVWLWWFLAVLTVSQLYYVRELFAAFVLFAIAYVAIWIYALLLWLGDRFWRRWAV